MGFHLFVAPLNPEKKRTCSALLPEMGTNWQRQGTVTPGCCCCCWCEFIFFFFFSELTIASLKESEEEKGLSGVTTWIKAAVWCWSFSGWVLLTGGRLMIRAWCRADENKSSRARSEQNTTWIRLLQLNDPHPTVTGPIPRCLCWHSALHFCIHIQVQIVWILEIRDVKCLSKLRFLKGSDENYCPYLEGSQALTSQALTSQPANVSLLLLICVQQSRILTQFNVSSPSFDGNMEGI